MSFTAVFAPHVHRLFERLVSQIPGRVVRFGDFHQLSLAIDAGQVHAVVAPSVATLGMRAGELLEWLHRMATLDVRVRFFAEDIDTDDRSGFVAINLLASLDGVESEGVRPYLTLLRDLGWSKTA